MKNIAPRPSSHNQMDGDSSVNFSLLLQIYLRCPQNTGSALLSLCSASTSTQCARLGRRLWAHSRDTCPPPPHSHARDPQFFVNLLPALTFAVCESCCFANLYHCFPLPSFYQRRLAIMTRGNTLKATAPSSSFFLNIQRSWKGKLLRFTRQN